MSATEEPGSGWTVGDQIHLLLYQLRHAYDDPNSSLSFKNAAFSDDANLAALAQLRSSDPVAYEQTIKEIRKITGLSERALQQALKDTISSAVVPVREMMAEDAEAEMEDMTPTIWQHAVRRAKAIEKEGKASDFILGVYQKRHDGDLPLGKALLFSFGSQLCSNSKGIHVVATGPSGYGKTDGIICMGNLIYPTYFKNGGVTPQSLYYQDAMPDGCVVGLEDVVWQAELGVTVKRISSLFQEGGTKLSTIDMQGVEVRSAKRIAFWASSVDNQCDEQLRDRFLMYEVKAGRERAKEIVSHMQDRDEGSEQVPADYDFETKVCQALTYEGRVIATAEDFENAKALYIELGGHDRDKYQGTELEILKAILGKGSASQADIQEATGLSSGRVSDVLNGRGKEGNGLIHKCGHLIVEEGRPKKYRLAAGFYPLGKVNIELV
jgi:hypothetical protein